MAAAARKKPTPRRGASRPQAPAAKKSLPAWAWLACGVLIGGFVVFLATLEPGNDAVQRPRESAQKPASAPATPKPKYDFYTLLPESEVIVPPEPTRPAPAPAKPAPKPVTPQEAARIDTQRAEMALQGKVPPPPPPVVASAAAPGNSQFFLQAGSFPTREQAESVRAQITLLGQIARLESGTVGDRTWHRVLVGPFGNREQMGRAQQVLTSNGFNNLLPQQRKVN